MVRTELDSRPGVDTGSSGVRPLGFIGLGVMGEPMCRNLAQKCGRHVLAYDRLAEVGQSLSGDSVQAARSPRAVARQAEIIFLALPSGRHVDALCRGEDGLLGEVQPGQVVVDLGTSPVGLTRELADAFSERGATFVDAPVARTRKAAQEGTLSVMVGATEAAFQHIHPLLACFASDITHCGPVGAGQAVKILNNMVLFITVAGLSEALAIGRRAGVKGDVLFGALSCGSADSFALRNHGMKAVLPNEFPTRSFSTEYALKDLSYAIDLAQELNCSVPSALVLEELFTAALDAGWGDQYWPVISRVIEARSS